MSPSFDKNNYIIDSAKSQVLAIGVAESNNMPIEAETSLKSAFIQGFQVKDCSCVLFVKRFYLSLQDKRIPSPKYLWQNYKDFNLQKFEKPMPNFLAITKDNLYFWHVGIVLEKTAEEIIILENNFRPCITATRSINIDSNLIVGFLY